MWFPHHWSISIGPPAWSRAAIRAFSLATLCVVLAIAIAFLREPLGWQKGGPARYATMALGFAPALVIFPYFHFSRRHIRRAWRNSGGRLCTHCVYDLSALEPEGVCPECGSAYNIESDAMLWKVVGLTREKP